MELNSLLLCKINTSFPYTWISDILYLIISLPFPTNASYIKNVLFYINNDDV